MARTPPKAGASSAARCGWKVSQKSASTTTAALFREEVRDVETLEVVLEDDGWAELLLDAATRGTLRKAMGLLAAKAEADDAAFFWGDD